MKLFLSLLIAIATLVTTAGAAEVSSNTKTATVFIANFDKFGNFTGWGSGFFIDEGIVVTNKHVIEGRTNFKIFATGSNDNVNLACAKQVTKSDMKINLEDDVAYIRVYLNCPHGIVHFAQNDPSLGEEVSVVGYPSEDTSEKTLTISQSHGIVTGYTYDKWLRTNAYIHSGNSGGPVIQDGNVVGVAVAKGVDSQGNYTEGYFVPNSVIVKGLLYANNSTFGYTAQDLVKLYTIAKPEDPIKAQKRLANDPFDPVPTGDIASNLDCAKSLGEGAEATGIGGCRCIRSYHPDDAKTMCLPGAPGWVDPYARPKRQQPVDEPISTEITEQEPPPSVTRKLPEDVLSSAWYAQTLQAFIDDGSLNEYELFRPQANVLRVEFIALLVKTIVGENTHSQQPEDIGFDDIPRKYMQYYSVAGEKGWIKGEGDCYASHPCYGRPNRSINRAEAATLTMRAFGLSTSARGPRFSDMEADAWYVSAINTAGALCILRGDEGKSTVRPSDPVNRAEMISMLRRATEKQIYPQCL